MARMQKADVGEEGDRTLKGYRKSTAKKLAEEWPAHGGKERTSGQGKNHQERGTEEFWKLLQGWELWEALGNVSSGRLS